MARRLEITLFNNASRPFLLGSFGSSEIRCNWSIGCNRYIRCQFYLIKAPSGTCSTFAVVGRS
jgi:hypothetical protein